MMYFWDLKDQSSEDFFHRRIVSDDEDYDELPIVAWTGADGRNAVPRMACAGRKFLLRIWSPKGGDGTHPFIGQEMITPVQERYENALVRTYTPLGFN